MSIVGSRVKPVDWQAKTSGEARFTLDVLPPDALHVAVLRSPHPHARIARLDVSPALAMPGVAAAITAADFAPDAMYLSSLAIADRPPLARGVVRFIGEEVAAVAAATPEQARAAVRAIDVRYRRLRAPLTPSAARRRFASRLHERGTDEPNVSVRNRETAGDFDAAVAASSVSTTATFSHPRVAQAPMEPSACIASWDAEAELLEIRTTTQTPLIVTEVVAEMLGLRQEQVVCREVSVGGSFGARSRLCEYEVPTAMLAYRTGRTVVTRLSREEEFSFTRGRHPFRTKLTGHAGADGRIRAFDAEIVMDNGAYNVTGPIVLAVGLHGVGGVYRLDATRWDARVVDTAIVPGGQMRGLGYPQLAIATESIVDELAEKQDIDPLAYRIANANYGGQRTVSGSPIGSADMKRALRLAGEAIGWEEKRADKTPYRGVGIAAGMHGSGDNGGRPDANRSDAAIDLFADGRVLVRYGAIDFGTHQRTVIAQVAAEELGVPFENVEVELADTERTTFELGQWGSRGTYFAGHAVRQVAGELSERLRGLAGRHFASGAAVALAEGEAICDGERIGLGELVALDPEASDGRLTQAGTYRDKIISFDPESQEVDDVSGTYTFAAHAAEVEVDPETGEIRILDYVAAHDVGRALNPTAVEGQIIGGAAMGLGALLGEELIYDHGKLVNPAYLHYALPRAADLPRIRPILVEGAVDNGPYGAKSVGEMPTVLAAPAVLNALYDATGVRFRELPVTPDKVLAALRRRDGVKPRRHRLWRRPDRWQIELMRRAYPYGVHALLHRFGRKVAGRSEAPPLEAVDHPDRLADLVAVVDGGTAVLGGGTDLQLQRRQGIARPRRVATVASVPELRELREEADGSLAIGAGVTLTELIDSAAVPEVIREAALTIASDQIRRVATVGGNLVQAKRCWFFRNGFDCYKRAGVTAPCYAVTGDHRFYHAAMEAHRCQAVTPSDLATALVALDASVWIAGLGGEREVAIADFYRGPGETVLADREVVTRVVVDAAARRRRGSYEKLGLWTGDFAVVSCAVTFGATGDGAIDPRLVFGAIAPTPWRARRTEAALARSIGPSMEEALETLDAELSAHGHPLAGNGWKLDAALGLAARALRRLALSPSVDLGGTDYAAVPEARR